MSSKIFFGALTATGGIVMGNTFAGSDSPFAQYVAGALTGLAVEKTNPIFNSIGKAMGYGVANTMIARFFVKMFPKEEIKDSDTQEQIENKIQSRNRQVLVLSAIAGSATMAISDPFVKKLKD